MPNRVAQETHLRLSHKRAFVAEEKYRRDEEREQDRAIAREGARSNQELIKALADGVVSKESPPARVVKDEPTVELSWTCSADGCGEVLTASGRLGLLAKQRAHEKKHT